MLLAKEPFSIWGSGSFIWIVYNYYCACSSVELECNSPKVEVTRLNRVKRTKLIKCVLIKCQDFFVEKVLILSNKKSFHKTVSKNNQIINFNKVNKLGMILSLLDRKREGRGKINESKQKQVLHSREKRH